MKPKISIIVAIDEKRGIGKADRIPWHIRQDLIRLKNLTLGHATILGRTTFESMLGYYQKSGKPTMSMRIHIVVTRDPNYSVEPKYGFAVHSIEEAISLAKEKEPEEIFIIGGAQIFQQAIDKGVVDRLYLTKVEGNFGCDTFFPDYSSFKKVVFEEEGEENGIKYKYINLEKQ